MQLAVLEKIRTDSVEMRSKAHYHFRVALAVFLAVVILGISIFLFNFMLFTVAASGRSLLLQFGYRGVLFFLLYFPWWLLAADIFLMLVLERMLRRFKFAYRLPGLYVLVSVLLFILAAGYVLDTADSNHRLVPGAGTNGRVQEGGFLSGVRQAPHVEQGVCRCTVLAVGQGELSVVDDAAVASGPILVLLPAGNPHVRAEGLMPGDRVYIAGDIHDGVLHAFGLHKASPGEPAFPRN